MSSRAVKNRPGVKRNRPGAVALSIFAVVVVFMAAMGIGVYTMVDSWFRDLPDYESADAFNTSYPTYVYAADRTTVLARFQLEYREPVALEQVNPLAVQATVATEDARFYEHAGVDYYGVMRALINNLTGGSLEGASTITQQFVRNTILSSEMDEISIKRKAREMYIATELEKLYSKNDILNMYLNTINYGSGAYGIEAASRTLKEYSPKAFEEFVDRIVAGKAEDGQFDNAEITIKDMGKIKEVLKNYLSQMYHERIAYPNRKK